MTQEPLREIPLHGGNVSTVSKLGDTVRRNVGPWTPAVHSLLNHLQRVGFTGSPHVLGMDERNREVRQLAEDQRKSRAQQMFSIALAVFGAVLSVIGGVVVWTVTSGLQQVVGR